MQKPIDTATGINHFLLRASESFNTRERVNGGGGQTVETEGTSEMKQGEEDEIKERGEKKQREKDGTGRIVLDEHTHLWVNLIE